MAALRPGRWLRWIVGLILVLAIVCGTILLFITSGVYSVAATYPDKTAVAWVLSNTMDNSVHRHARDIKVPTLDDPTMIREGAKEYHEMCVVCHGAPGVPIGHIGRGLNPDPPKLTEAASDWKSNELFWITKNGVRMSGMPAWGKTHSDKEIWSIVAFVRKLPSMTPAQYRALAPRAPQAER